MNKVFKIIAWVIGILGLVLAILAMNGQSPDTLIRFTYVVIIAAVVIWVGLAIILAAKNNPKGLIKSCIVLVAACVLVFVVYSLASVSPAYNVKTQPSDQMLKLSETMLILTYILAGCAVLAICFGAIKNSLKK